MTQESDDTTGLGGAVMLDGVIVRGERNLLGDTALPGIEGARAALETFYYAFNTHSVDLLKEIWAADDPLAQVVSPLGFARGSAQIAAAYGRVLSEPMGIQTVLDDIVAYITPGLVVFTERERGTDTQGDSGGGGSGGGSSRRSGGRPGLVEGRTTCLFRFLPSQGGWRLIYHQVSLSDPDTLARLQRARRVDKQV
jgi:hypothetical protein